jgi:uncharacterized protein (DUF58 family)
MSPLTDQNETTQAAAPVVSAEMLRRIRRIELKTRRLVRDPLVGAYHSMFKGTGMMFESVRPYEPGDPIRQIDWNVTARQGGVPYVKRYQEERELTVLLALDASASCFFGTGAQNKREQAAELAAVIALTAIRNNDKVGLLVFSDQVEHFTPPRKGRDHTLRLIRDALVVQPRSNGTDLGLALRTLDNILKKRAVVFLISDYLASRDEYAIQLQIVSRRHELIAVVLSDPLEVQWPPAGLVTLRDAETGEHYWADTDRENWRAAFTARAERFTQMRDSVLRRAGVACLDLPMGADPVDALATFLQKQSAKQRAKQRALR